MKYIVGVDLGGSHIKTILTDNTRKIHKEITLKLHSKSKDEALHELYESIYFVLTGIDKSEVKGIGVGVPGINNKDKVTLPNIPEFENVDILSLLEKEFKMDIFMNNDGNCAVLAEKTKYKEENLVAITLGTGVSCGIIINGELYEGRGNAGEFSHITLFSAGSECSCGNYGCLEEYVSTRGILKIARKLGLDFESVADLTKFAKTGNKKAQKVLELAGRYLGVALSDLIKILDPERIVVGGGISKAGNLILKSTKDEIKKRTFFKPPKIVLSKMKDNAVAIGAASLLINDKKD